MNTVLSIVLIILLLIILVAILAKNSIRKLELRRVKWLEEEGNCQIDVVPGTKLEYYCYKEGEREISILVTWADLKNGVRIHMDGFEDSSVIIPIEENKIVAARILKYLGYVRSKDTLKLNYEGFAHPSDELVKQIEDKIKPFGFVRVSQDNSQEITWIKK